MEWLLEETEKKYPVKYKGDSADLYAWYYHTQACLMFGGSAWTKWNRWFQDEICDVQKAIHDLYMPAQMRSVNKLAVLVVRPLFFE